MDAADFEQQRKHLPDVGSALESACMALYAHPSVEQANALAIQLEGARRFALTLAEVIGQEVNNAKSD